MELFMVNDINKTEFLELLEKPELSLVEFYGSTCGPCKMQAMMLEKIQDENPDIANKINFYKICIDDMDDIIEKFDIKSVPTIIVLKNKQVVNTFKGIAPINILVAFLDEI